MWLCFCCSFDAADSLAAYILPFSGIYCVVHFSVTPSTAFYSNACTDALQPLLQPHMRLQVCWQQLLHPYKAPRFTAGNVVPVRAAVARCRAGCCPITLLRHGVHTCAEDSWDHALACNNEGAITSINVDVLTPETLTSFEAMYASYGAAKAVSLARPPGSPRLLLLPCMFLFPPREAEAQVDSGDTSEAVVEAQEQHVGAAALLAAGHSAGVIAHALRGIEDAGWPALSTGNAAAAPGLPLFCSAFGAALSAQLQMRHALRRHA